MTALSSQGHNELSINLTCGNINFFPWPEAIALKSDFIGIFNFIFCSAAGKYDRHGAYLSVLSHCLCQFLNHSFFSSVPIVVIGAYCIL